MGVGLARACGPGVRAERGASFRQESQEERGHGRGGLEGDHGEDAARDAAEEKASLEKMAGLWKGKAAHHVVRGGTASLRVGLRAGRSHLQIAGRAGVTARKKRVSVPQVVHQRQGEVRQT